MSEDQPARADASEEPLPEGWVDVPGYRGPDRRTRQRSSRFLDRYERRRREAHNRLVRPARVGAGVLLIVLGVAIGWLPGPGSLVLLALPGALLVASEVRRAATALDRAENETVPRLQQAYARWRGGPRRAWEEADPRMWAEWRAERQAELAERHEHDGGHSVGHRPAEEASEDGTA